MLLKEKNIKGDFFPESIENNSIAEMLNQSKNKTFMSS